MRTCSGVTIALVSALAFVPSAEALDANKKAEAQGAIRKESQATLSKLYAAKPSAKAAVEKAAGYAAFDNFGMNLTDPASAEFRQECAWCRSDSQ